MGLNEWRRERKLQAFGDEFEAGDRRETRATGSAFTSWNLEQSGGVRGNVRLF